MKTSRIIIGALLAASVLGGAEAKKPQAPAMPVPTVLADKAILKTNTVTRKYVGVLKALYDATIVARVSGNIDDQLLPHGSFVKKDQVILQLEDTVYKAQVKAVKAQIAQTEAELKYAKSNFQRQKKLFSQNATSESTFEDAQLQYSCLENPMDREAWQAIVYGVTKELDMT